MRALARALGRPDADDVRVPGHKPGRPETLTDTDYANLLRVPDARTTIGRRNIALLRVLGDCGLRSAEMRGLTAGDRESLRDEGDPPAATTGSHP